MVGQVFKVGGYLRLSNEDGENKQSESIDNQKLVIQHFLAEHKELKFVDTYIDDGYSGMNYDRKAFQKMMKDIDQGRINTIITKDLSRLGRDQVETARLLKKEFVLRKVRYIAIDDNIDTFSPEQNDIIVPFRILFNDFYSKDISVKIKAALNSKRKNGEFIGAFSPYGYKKNEQDNNSLIPDPYAAKTVNRIFRMFLAGYGKLKIAKALNEEGILCPTEYKQKNFENYRNSRKLEETKYWTYSTINRILHNEVYIGNMVQHKQEKIAYNLKQHRAVPKEEQIIVEQVHTPIIERDLFDSVQKMLKTKTRTINFNSNISMYSGILKCGDCGRNMAKTISKTESKTKSKITSEIYTNTESVSKTVSTPKTVLSSKTESTSKKDNDILTKIYTYYKCGTYKQYGKNQCSSHTIREDRLDEIVLELLRGEAKRILHTDNIMMFRKTIEQTLNEKDHNKSKEIKDHLLELQKEHKRMLRLLAKGIINEEDYKKFKQMNEEEQKKLKQLQEEYMVHEKRQKQEKSQNKKWMEQFIDYMNIEKLTREVLISFIEEIKIYEDNQIEIQFRFEK